MPISPSTAIQCDPHFALNFQPFTLPSQKGAGVGEPGLLARGPAVAAAAHLRGDRGAALRVRGRAGAGTGAADADADEAGEQGGFERGDQRIKIKGKMGVKWDSRDGLDGHQPTASRCDFDL